MRCQPPGDIDLDAFQCRGREVSISDEMPAPWRQEALSAMRDARGVSISDEMPAPWRLLKFQDEYKLKWLFQSQMRCQPPGDAANGSAETSRFYWFQSQMRCQPPGDLPHCAALPGSVLVSISDEMPAPWRRQATLPMPAARTSFNLR